MLARLTLASLIVLASSTLHATDLHVIAWNVEDGGAIPRANEQRLRQLVAKASRSGACPKSIRTTSTAT